MGLAKAVVHSHRQTILLNVSSKIAALPILRTYRPTKYENIEHRSRPDPRLDICLENKNRL
ncbi:hypothetical protein BS47DRAFT_1348361 [Hydnum rufescens UP504]|uniref:Uncharacterized protein n=1 Tax=Hydnum rufescens UP504 TaxID=1448309 RepID=A0A9P6AQB6_9AGAM|nr:hypothetical protein BS47DRAFT_1348361 [Hydnum rufescens UP504]